MAQEQDKERAQPVAWMDDGSTGIGKHSEYRVVTDVTKRGMHASLAAAFTTPLYAAPQPNAALDDGCNLGSLQAELAGAEAANLHLSAMVDELRALLARAMLVMKQLHSAASPDETREDCPPIISAEAFALFVNQNAALLHAIHRSGHKLPAPPLSTNASKEGSHG